MLQSLAHPFRRREYADQVETAPVSGTAAPGLDFENPELLQLVHDLRNQLTVVTLWANDLQDAMPHDQAVRLGDLHYAAEQAVLLINAILAGEHSLPSGRKVVDGNEVVRRTAQTLSHLKKDAIRLRLDIWSEPLGVLAAPGSLDRVLLNLILNALDAMPDGGVLTLETGVAHARAPIDAMPAGPYARLTVRDTGCGMTAEVKGRIFEAFFTTKENGTGLGLRSVALTVQQLQGRISVESEPGRGTSVTIMLPLATEISVLDFPAAGAPRD
jgi:two-component system, cell cycle sensor histidine kinase and response regulator CckA